MFSISLNAELCITSWKFRTAVDCYPALDFSLFRRKAAVSTQVQDEVERRMKQAIAAGGEADETDATDEEEKPGFFGKLRAKITGDTKEVR